MLTGYKVLITGATSGIGLATAKEFLAQGACVIGIGRDFSRTGDLGENFIPCICDITKEENIDAAVALVEEKFGSLDTLILNAGAGIASTPETITGENLDFHYELLLKPNVLFVQKLVPLLRKNESGNPSIAMTASTAAFMVDDTFPYNLIKSAVASFSRQCARTLKGIRVNAICPGLIHTNLMPEEVWAALGTEQALQQIPSRRIGRPEEPAKLFAFLSSKRASYVSGALITIDGGWLTTHPRFDY